MNQESFVSVRARMYAAIELERIIPTSPNAVIAKVLTNTRGNSIAVHARTKFAKLGCAGNPMGLSVISASVLNAFMIT